MRPEIIPLGEGGGKGGKISAFSDSGRSAFAKSTETGVLIVPLVKVLLNQCGTVSLPSAFV